MQAFKAEVNLEIRASFYTEKVRCDLPGTLTSFCSVQAILSGRIGKMCPAQRDKEPPRPTLSINIQCFSEQISSYKTLSCVIAPVIAEMLVISLHTLQKGYIKVVYKGKAVLLKAGFKSSCYLAIF